MVVAVATVALATLNALTLSLVSQKIAIEPLISMASTLTLTFTPSLASTSTSTATTAWFVYDPPPSLGLPMTLYSRPGCQVRISMGKRGKRGGGR